MVAPARGAMTRAQATIHLYCACTHCKCGVSLAMGPRRLPCTDSCACARALSLFSFALNNAPSRALACVHVPNNSTTNTHTHPSVCGALSAGFVASCRCLANRLLNIACSHIPPSHSPLSLSLSFSLALFLPVCLSVCSSLPSASATYTAHTHTHTHLHIGSQLCVHTHAPRLAIALDATDGFKKHGEPLLIYTCEREPIYYS